MLIRIYFHIATINNWEDVVGNMWKKIRDSGLLEIAHDINISVLGAGDPEAVSHLLNFHPKVKIRYSSFDLSEYERPILRILRQDAIEMPFKALYIHSKGIRDHTQSNLCVKDWVDYLIYFNVERWKQNVKVLNDYQTCGVNWKDKPSPHYSGNFWWARSDYLAGLPANIGPDYLSPEMWLGTNNPNYKCLFYSHINHYFDRFPEAMYKAPPTGLFEEQISSSRGTDPLHLDRV